MTFYCLLHKSAEKHPIKVKKPTFSYLHLFFTEEIKINWQTESSYCYICVCASVVVKIIWYLYLNKLKIKLGQTKSTTKKNK